MSYIFQILNKLDIKTLVKLYVNTGRRYKDLFNEAQSRLKLKLYSLQDEPEITIGDLFIQVGKDKDNHNIIFINLHTSFTYTCLRVQKNKNEYHATIASCFTKCIEDYENILNKVEPLFLEFYIRPLKIMKDDNTKITVVNDNGRVTLSGSKFIIAKYKNGRVYGDCRLHNFIADDGQD